MGNSDFFYHFTEKVSSILFNESLLLKKEQRMCKSWETVKQVKHTRES